MSAKEALRNLIHEFSKSIKEMKCQGSQDEACGYGEYWFSFAAAYKAELPRLEKILSESTTDAQIYESIREIIQKRNGAVRRVELDRKEDPSGCWVDGWEHLEAWWEDLEAQAEGRESIAEALTRFLEECGQPCDDIKAVV